MSEWVCVCRYVCRFVCTPDPVQSRGRSSLVPRPTPPLLRAKKGLVTKVGILGGADSAVVGKLRNKT